MEIEGNGEAIAGRRKDKAMQVIWLPRARDCCIPTRSRAFHPPTSAEAL